MRNVSADGPADEAAEGGGYSSSQPPVVEAPGRTAACQSKGSGIGLMGDAAAHRAWACTSKYVYVQHYASARMHHVNMQM